MEGGEAPKPEKGRPSTDKRVSEAPSAGRPSTDKRVSEVPRKSTAEDDDLERSDSKRTSMEKRLSTEPKSASFAEDVVAPLDTVVEVNENVLSEILDKPTEVGEYVELSPRIFSKKDILAPNVTIDALNTAIYELGIINMCWPEIKDPRYEERTCFPWSYYNNTKKERLLLSYAESFRRQMHFHFKHTRKPLFLQAPNDCGLQKMVCTSIRPTRLCHRGTNVWEGLASLVSDYFEYEPLEKSMLHPERILSSYTVLVRRKGNPFEIAHILCSWLIGALYDAYVVVGCAARDTCLHIRYRTECQEVPDETPVVEEEVKPEEEPRYKLVPLPDFTSKYCKMMDEREALRQQKEAERKAAERAARIAELEKPPPDKIDGWRTHAWILVLPGPMGVEKPFFIEPAEGIGYPLDAPQYQQIDSIYNSENYYANLQVLDVKRIVPASVEGFFDEVGEDQNLSHLSYDLSDLSCWEHLLSGEPFSRRVLVGVDVNDRRTCVETEKHLDMPASWVEKLDISAADFSQRYPGFQKIVNFKKVILEKYALYSQRDGIIKRVRKFADYGWTIPLVTWEYYTNRDDKMHYVRRDHVKQIVEEEFLEGRLDYLIKHTYAVDANPLTIEANRTLEFKWQSRLDQLCKIVCTPLTFDEYYIDREDRLETRFITFTEGEKKDGVQKRQIKDITETYKRNPAVKANEDVWKRIFHLQDGTIELLYHYRYNFVTNDTRSFVKPNLAETAGKILFYEDKTSGYIADPFGKPTRPLTIYYALCDNLKFEYRTGKQNRDREIDIHRYLRQRYKESTEPTLYVSLFNTERNLEAQRGYQEQERLKAEMAEREKEADLDPLTPYLARMFGTTFQLVTDPLPAKDAALLREQCINDFKARQLARQLLVQDRFDKSNEEYKAKRLWYLANQFILTPEKEAAYFALSAELSFQVHALEVRLTRHMELSGLRYRVLEEMMDRHPLLVKYNEILAYFKGKGQMPANVLA